MTGPRPAAQVVDLTEINDLINTRAVTWSDVAFAGLAFLVGLGLAWVLRRVVRKGMARFPKIPEYVVQLVVKATGWLVVLIAGVYALSLLGVDLGPVVILLVIIALVLFFAGRSLLDNFAAGLVLQAGSLFDVGDQVAIGDEAGTVAEIHGRAVLVETVDGRQVHIPNRKVLTDVVVNLTRNQRRRTTIEVGVEYGTDLDAAARALLDAVGGCERAFADPPPEAFLAEYGDSSIDFDLRFWHEPTIWGQHAAVDEVIRAVNRVFGERGIVIAFPQRVIWYGTRPDPEAAGAGDPRHSVG